MKVKILQAKITIMPAETTLIIEDLITITIKMLTAETHIRTGNEAGTIPRQDTNNLLIIGSREV